MSTAMLTLLPILLADRFDLGPNAIGLLQACARARACACGTSHASSLLQL